MSRLRKRVHGLLRCSLPILGWLALTDLTADYRWVTGTVEEFTVYANTSKGTAVRVIEDFHRLRVILAQMVPHIVPKNSVPLRV